VAGCVMAATIRNAASPSASASRFSYRAKADNERDDQNPIFDHLPPRRSDAARPPQRDPSDARSSGRSHALAMLDPNVITNNTAAVILTSMFVFPRS
jgi:hypothetical protein